MTEAAAAFAQKPSTAPRQAAARRPAAPSPVKAVTAGMMLRRPDLSDEAVIAAIAERLRFEDRDPHMAAAVLKWALAGRPAAKALLRRLVLPAPQSPLQMPVQAILGKGRERRASPSWMRLVSFGR